MEIKDMTKEHAIETLERINRWNYTYDDNDLGDARFRIKVDTILKDIEDSELNNHR